MEIIWINGFEVHVPILQVFVLETNKFSADIDIIPLEFNKIPKNS